jgi:hypothetical protein
MALSLNRIAVVISFVGFLFFLCGRVFAEVGVFLGNHVFYISSYPSTSKMMFSGVRIWANEGTTWRAIQPSPGVFNFSALDAHVDTAQAKGFDVMLTLGQTPEWASARPDEKANLGLGAAAEPRDMSFWESYVRELARRYKGRVSAYEIMNEPRIPEAVRPFSPGFFSGKAEALALMTKIAAESIRSIDPQAKIVCPAMDDGDLGVKRLSRFLDTGAGRYCDVIGFHFYLKTNTINELRDLIIQVKKVMAKHGVDNKQLWNTEGGILVSESGFNVKPVGKTGAFSKVFDGEEAARFAARYIITSHSLGVERTYWFAYDSSSMGSLTPNKKLGKLNTLGKALQEINAWLSTRTLQACVGGAASQDCRVITQEGKWVGDVYWGAGNAANYWQDKGYRKILMLNGSKVDLGSLPGANQRAVFPSQTDEPIFLAR